MTKRELIRKLTKTISDNFQKNVLAVIQIGSFNRKFFSFLSDLDLIFIIKKPSEKFNTFLRKLFSKYQKPIDPSFIYIYKKKDSRTLFGTHGYYMIDHLSQGKVLFGKNPFIVKQKKVPFPQIQKELLSKIKEYLYERKKWYLTGDISSIKEQYKFANRLCKAVLDLLIIDGTISNWESCLFEFPIIFKKASSKYIWASFVYSQLKKYGNLNFLRKKNYLN